MARVYLTEADRQLAKEKEQDIIRMKLLKKRIKHYVDEYDMTQGDYAKMVGINPQTLSLWVNHPGTLSKAIASNLYGLLNPLRLPADELAIITGLDIPTSGEVEP